MPSRAEMIDDILKSQGSSQATSSAAPSREQMISDIMQAQKDQPSVAQSLKIGVEKGVTLGARPFVAGLAGGAGGFVGTLQSGGGLMDAVKSAKDSFSQARADAQSEQKISEAANPKASMIGELGGTILTLPYSAGKGVMGATKLGALSGAGTALGEANSVSEGAADVALGAAGGAATFGLAKGAGAIGSKLAQTAPGQAVVSAAGKVLSLPKQVALKVSSALTGISEQDIATYAAQTNQVDALIKKSGGDLTGEADNLRRNLSNKLQATRQGLNSQISAALADAPKDKIIDATPIITQLESAKARVNSGLNPEQLTQLDDLIGKVSTQTVDGKIDVKSLYEVGQFLQDRAKSAYLKDGQIFLNKGPAQQAAKQAAGVARKILNPLSPEIAEANSKLAYLHGLEDKLNSNLIKEGGSDSALFAAAKGANPRNAQMLNRLGEATGTDPLGDAKVLSAARTFSSAPLVPTDFTGKAAARMILGGAAGKAVGGDDGAAIGAIAANPGLLKKVIQTGAISRRLSQAIVQKATGSAVLNDAAIVRTIDFLKTNEGKAVLSNLDGDSAMHRRLRGQ